MLVLSRKIGERILIGSGIEVIVANVCGNRVRIGIVAPRDVPVHRAELARRLQSPPLVERLGNLSTSPQPGNELQT